MSQVDREKFSLSSYLAIGGMGFLGATAVALPIMASRGKIESGVALSGSIASALATATWASLWALERMSLSLKNKKNTITINGAPIKFSSLPKTTTPPPKTNFPPLSKTKIPPPKTNFSPLFPGISSVRVTDELPEELRGIYTHDKWMEARELDRLAEEMCIQYREWKKRSDQYQDFFKWRVENRKHATSEDFSRVNIFCKKMGFSSWDGVESPPQLADQMIARDTKAAEAFKTAFSALLKGIRGENELREEEMQKQLEIFKLYVDHRRDKRFSARAEAGDLGDYYCAWKMILGDYSNVIESRSLKKSESDVVIAWGVHVNGNHYKALVMDPVKGEVDLDNILSGRQKVYLTPGEGATEPIVLSVKKERFLDLERKKTTCKWRAPTWWGNNCYLATAAILHAVADLYNTDS